jgi:hypothetical protein
MTRKRLRKDIRRIYRIAQMYANESWRERTREGLRPNARAEHLHNEYKRYMHLGYRMLKGTS